MLIFTAFILLVGLTVSTQVSRQKLQAKSYEDWLVDSLGLIMQGLLIPGLQVGVIYPIYSMLLPQQQHWLPCPLWLSFGLSFIGIDYIYYWNHRALHHPFFWPWHQVHHTVTEMDVFGTSRNTLWTSFAIVYLWLNPLWVYWLQDANGYLIGVSLTAVLDLWRHSQFGFAAGSWGDRLLRSWLVLPQDHAWHHASQAQPCNFGANLKLWDYWHGTAQDSRFAQAQILPASLGTPVPLTLTRKLLFPFL